MQSVLKRVLSFFFFVIFFVCPLISSAQDDLGLGESSGFGDSSFLIGLSFFYTGDNFELSSDRKRNDTLLQGLLGYKNNNWLFGISYDSDVEKQTFVAGNTTQTVSWTRQAFGPTIGYFLADFLFHLTYFVSPTLSTVDDLNSINTEYSSSSGMQLVAAYNHNVTSSFSMGVQIAYRFFEFGESQAGTTTTTSNFRQASVDPMLTLMIWM